MLINFADKAVVGLASVPIMQELQLSHTQFGLLGSAFFLLFSASGVAVGFLANRFSTKTIMCVMGVVWAAALLPMSIVSSFAVLVGSRVVLGAAEGPAFPVAVHAVYKWFGNERRALPTSVVASGAAFGAGIVAPMIIWIIDHFGWHAAFGTLGAVGLAWAALLAGDRRRGAGADHAVGLESGLRQRVPYRHLLMSRTAVGFYLAGFAAYWIIALNLVWLGNYLIRPLGMAPAHAAWVIALPSAMQIVLAPGLAYLSQRLSLLGFIESSLLAAWWALCASSSPASRWPAFLSSGWGPSRYCSWGWRARSAVSSSPWARHSSARFRPHRNAVRCSESRTRFIPSRACARPL